MKMADVTPFCKKESRAVKNDYCPANILTNLPKVFERYLYKQFSPYFDNIFSKNSVDLGKIITLSIAASTTGKFKGNADQGKIYGSLLTDLLLPRWRPMGFIQKH